MSRWASHRHSGRQRRSIRQREQAGGQGVRLKAEEEAKETAKVIRDGRLSEIHVSEVVVGDIVFLQAGDKIPADGVIAGVRSRWTRPPSTARPRRRRKTAPSGGETYDIKDLLNASMPTAAPWCAAARRIWRSRWWATRPSSASWPWRCRRIPETPLQVKLGKLANQISTFGYIGDCHCHRRAGEDAADRERTQRHL